MTLNFWWHWESESFLSVLAILLNLMVFNLFAEKLKSVLKFLSEKLQFPPLSFPSSKYKSCSKICLISAVGDPVRPGPTFSPDFSTYNHNSNWIFFWTDNSFRVLYLLNNSRWWSTCASCSCLFGTTWSNQLWCL